MVKDFLIDYINKIGITLSDIQVNQLNKYYEMLVEKNKVMNLTAITEYQDVVIKHFADSLAIIKAFNLNDENKDLTMIDIGTGAGFPGVVLKIVFPGLKITLLDSLNKRINFLNDVIKELGLENITTIHGRAEDFAHDKKFREKYDVCVSRAVANLSTLSEYCIPFVKLSGYFISYKAGGSEEEIKTAENAVKKLGGCITKVVDIVLPDSDIDRTFVVINKITNTKGNFPRKAGIPSKDPLI